MFLDLLSFCATCYVYNYILYISMSISKENEIKTHALTTKVNRNQWILLMLCTRAIKMFVTNHVRFFTYIYNNNIYM